MKRTAGRVRKYVAEHQSLEGLDEGAFEREFGKPPYEFLQGGIPERFPGRRRRNILPDAYREQHPQPNYSHFGEPEWVDSEGREYRRARKGPLYDQLLAAGEIQRAHAEDPSLDTSDFWGKQLFDLRLPIALRREVKFPRSDSLDAETLYLRHILTGVSGTGIVTRCVNNPRGATGYVIIDNFTTLGQIPGEERPQKQKRSRDPFGTAGTVRELLQPIDSIHGVLTLLQLD